MKPISTKMMKHLATHPSDMVKYQTTGRTPNATCPTSPLIQLLEALTPRERLEIKGLKIHNLGYTNGQVWQNAEQLLRWLKPSNEIFGTYPAGSYQDRRFQKRLSLQDLKDNAHTFPQSLEKRLSPK